MARGMKNLAKEKGILSTPNSKLGKMLNEVITELVVDSYNADNVSRMMPGKKGLCYNWNKCSKVQV